MGLASCSRGWTPTSGVLHLDLGFDRQVERGGDEAVLLCLFGELARLPLVRPVGGEVEPQQEAGEAEASVVAAAADAVRVDAKLLVGEARLRGEAGERDGEARGGCGDEEVLRAPGGRVGAAEYGRRDDLDRLLSLDRCRDPPLADPVDGEREVELLRPYRRPRLPSRGAPRAPAAAVPSSAVPASPSSSNKRPIVAAG
jgi:hypothetical protein